METSRVVVEDGSMVCKRCPGISCVTTNKQYLLGKDMRRVHFVERGVLLRYKLTGDVDNCLYANTGTYITVYEVQSIGKRI